MHIGIHLKSLLGGIFASEASEWASTLNMSSRAIETVSVSSDWSKWFHWTKCLFALPVNLCLDVSFEQFNRNWLVQVTRKFSYWEKPTRKTCFFREMKCLGFSYFLPFTDWRNLTILVCTLSIYKRWNYSGSEVFLNTLRKF